jgi:SAM-dependent MidA family methyltransferase
LHSSRSAGTLKCHFQHQVHDDPFVLPGLQDITTAVNFTDVAELGDEAGFRLAGFSTQTRFLLNCGLHDVMAASSSGDIGEDYMLAQEAKRLLLPGEMGQTVKLMALAIDYDAPLIGFSSDERHRLEGFNSSAE